MGQEVLRKLARSWLSKLGLNRRPPPFNCIGAKSIGSDNLDPDMTVLIPAFRHESFIEDALRSVLTQTYPAFRIIVVDDASPDATSERARSLKDPRITVKINVTNMGLGNSVISALEGVTTPFVALLNSDDLFHPERLERCREVLLRSSVAQVVATGVSLIDTDGGHITFDKVSRVLDGRRVYHWVRWLRDNQSCADDEKSIFLRLLKYNFLLTSSNIVCRTPYIRAWAETLTGLKYCLDWQIFLNASIDGALTYLPEELVAYRLHPRNTVWMSGNVRSGYIVEVNRVAGQVLKRYASLLAQSDMGNVEIESRLETAISNLSAHAEVDSRALSLDEILSTLQPYETGDWSLRIRSPIEPHDGQSKRTGVGRAKGIKKFFVRG